MLFNPAAGKWTLALLFPIWLISHCISRLSTLGITRFIMGPAQYYYSLSVSILGIIMGMIILFNPWPSVLYIGYLAEIVLIVIGTGSIARAFS